MITWIKIVIILIIIKMNSIIIMKCIIIKYMIMMVNILNKIIFLNMN